jgi:hypothetical protein
MEYSVSIIPEAGFQMFYSIYDAVGELLQMANGKDLLLRATTGK